MDLSVSCLVVAKAEFAGVLESAFVGEALDKHIDELAKFAECPERSEDRRASRGTKCLICLFRRFFCIMLFVKFPPWGRENSTLGKNVYDIVPCTWPLPGRSRPFGAPSFGLNGDLWQP